MSRPNSMCRRPSSCQSGATIVQSHIIQLEPVPIAEIFEASNVLLRRASRWRPTRPGQVVWLATVTTAILLLVWITAMPPSSIIFQGSWQYWIGPLLLATTLVTVGPIIALHHRRLPQRLFSSFDFIFLQLTALSHAMCDLMLWVPHRCTVAACAWVWFYVLATHDALTPVVKRALSWTAAKAAVSSVVLLVMHRTLCSTNASNDRFDDHKSR